MTPLTEWLNIIPSAMSAIAAVAAARLTMKILDSIYLIDELEV